MFGFIMSEVEEIEFHKARFRYWTVSSKILRNHWTFANLNSSYQLSIILNVVVSKCCRVILICKKDPYFPIILIELFEFDCK